MTREKTKLTLLYFAALRDASGTASEVVETDARSLRELYQQAQARYQLPFSTQQLRVAVDAGFAEWDDAPLAGSEVAFIPPVSGG